MTRFPCRNTRSAARTRRRAPPPPSRSPSTSRRDGILGDHVQSPVDQSKGPRPVAQREGYRKPAESLGLPSPRVFTVQAFHNSDCLVRSVRSYLVSDNRFHMLVHGHGVVHLVGQRDGLDRVGFAIARAMNARQRSLSSGLTGSTKASACFRYCGAIAAAKIARSWASEASMPSCSAARTASSISQRPASPRPARPNTPPVAASAAGRSTSLSCPTRASASSANRSAFSRSAPQTGRQASEGMTANDGRDHSPGKPAFPEGRSRPLPPQWAGGRDCRAGGRAPPTTPEPAADRSPPSP